MRIDSDREKNALIVFAKEPRLNRVKTRLLKDFSAQATTRLYTAFVKDVLKTARIVRCHKKFIYYTGARNIPFLGRFQKNFFMARQRGKNLGERMYAAFAKSRNDGNTKTVIIGTDCPTLGAGDIREAFRKLTNHDVVLGPCRDGGYYLIGLKEPKKSLFANIRWSSSAVLRETIQRAIEIGKKVYLLGQREDIDTVENLRNLLKNKRAQKQARHTFALAKKMTNGKGSRNGK